MDYANAFDVISNYGRKYVNGNILNVIMNMYSSAKYCIENNREFIKVLFICEMGLQQGENLSPSLFSVFINHFSEYISIHYKGFDIANIYSGDIVFMKLFSLLYVDDTIILTESDSDAACKKMETF